MPEIEKFGSGIKSYEDLYKFSVEKVSKNCIVSYQCNKPSMFSLDGFYFSLKFSGTRWHCAWTGSRNSQV